MCGANISKLTFIKKKTNTIKSVMDGLLQLLTAKTLVNLKKDHKIIEEVH